MNQQLPPAILVKTWLDIIHYQETPLCIKRKYIKEIIYYFGSIEFADMYLEQHQHSFKKAS
jgi:hypothetical protein